MKRKKTTKRKKKATENVLVRTAKKFGIKGDALKLLK